MPRGENLTTEMRSRGGQKGAPSRAPSSEASRRGGENSPTTFSEGNPYATSDYTWHRDRNDILREHPELWEEYGDEPPKHPGGEINEEVEAILDD